MKKYWHISLVLIMMLALALSGCGGGNGGSPTPPGDGGSPTTGTISGKVLDTYNSRNYPVVGAVITAGSVTAKTGDDGSYTMQVAPGSYTVTMSAWQYVSSNTSKTVTNGETTTADFTTEPATVPAPISFGETGTGASELTNPWGMYEGTDNLIYIADRDNNRIQVLDPTGTGQFVRNYGTLGTSPGQLNVPNFLVLDNMGNIYVSEISNHRIQKIIPGTVTTYQTWDCNGGTTTTYPLWYPKGIAWGPQNQLYVVSQQFSGNSVPTLAIYNPNGTYVSQMGLPAGTVPSGLAIDLKHNKMYIGDFSGKKVLVYSYNAGFWTQGTDITDPNSFGAVEGLWVDSNGYLWVADSGMNKARVAKFDPSGRWIMKVGTGSGSYSKGVLIDHNGYLLVSVQESGGGPFRIQYFKF